ncbi:MAG TPA: NAD(P)/FAD-dependent oxidoreductase [Ornithinibacter sp.]|nr:NAD(P)/FAD-dependent oxidoreductase [Ornithinibacter sp.]
MNDTPLAHAGSERTWQADVVVVGARCAGAATAMLLADAGHDVLVLDRASFPSDTVSTHVLARTGMVQLHRWGLLRALHDSGAPRVTTVEFDTGDAVVVRTIKDRHGVDHLLAPRRIVLDGILQEAARRAGARIETGVSVDGVLTDAGGRVIGVRAHDARGGIRVHARQVVGADGLGSRVARSIGAPLTLERPDSGAGVYAYFAGEWSSIDYHVGADVLAGIFPTHGGEACVWVCTTEEVARRHQRQGPRDAVVPRLLAELTPALAARVEGCVQTSPARGMLRMPNHFRQASGPGWSLVGDAGYHRDAITGFGISDAFRDAELLACALDEALRDPAAETAALTAYGRTRDRMARPVFDITCELATFPGTDRFVELQRQLAVAIDDQAAELAARPSPARAAVA